MNTVKEGKMWFLHCQLLTKIMVQILTKKIKLENVSVFFENFQTEIIKVFGYKIYGDIEDSQKDPEYIFFKKIARKKDNHKKEIRSIIDGLSGPAFRVASDLTSGDFNWNEENNKEHENTALWYILVIGYFNRIICLGTEGVVKEMEKCHSGNKKENWYEKNKTNRVQKILNGDGNSNTPKNDAKGRVKNNFPFFQKVGERE